MSTEQVAAGAAGQDRDDGAFAREWVQALPQVRAYARWALGQPAEAEDLVQAVALRAWRGYATFRGDSAFATWALAIARREAARSVARRRRLAEREVPLPEDPGWVAAEPGRESAVGDAPRLAEAARSAYERGDLNATELAVLLAQLAEPNRSWAELGEGLGVPAGRCAVAHCRAVVKLRVALFLHHPELLGSTQELERAAKRAARRTKGVALTPAEVEVFRRLVLERDPAHRPRNWAALLRGACAKVAEELFWDR